MEELRLRVGAMEALLREYGIVGVPDVKTEQATNVASAAQTGVIPKEERGNPLAGQPLSWTTPQDAEPLQSFGAMAGAEERSLESRIGSHWFNRIGILAVLIGMAWFLKLAIDNHWIGPAGRVVIGLLAGAGLIAWSERFYRRKYAGFAYSLKAVGSGILYLSLWAAFSLFHLIPSSVAFAAMILVTAFNGFMSWMQDAELLAVYAIAGGLSTPLLLSTGENHEISLFTYLLVMNLAVLVLVALKPWSRLLLGAFTGTVLFYNGWYSVFYSHEQAGQTAIILTCFFLLFSLAPRLMRVREGTATLVSKFDQLVQVAMPVATAALGFLGYFLILNSVDEYAATPWLAVAFAAFYLGLIKLPERGRLRKGGELLDSLHLAAAVVFLTIALPLKTNGRWLTAGWLVEGAALLWVASRIKSSLLQAMSLMCLLLGLLMVFWNTRPASLTPIWNQRFATYCIGIATYAFVTWLAKQQMNAAMDQSAVGWDGLAAVASLVVDVLVLVAVSFEIHSYWWFRVWSGDWNLLNQYRMYAQFTYSAWFMLFGALLLAAGLWRRIALLRWQALVLLAAAIGKVFTVDVSELSQGYRILSFLGLGALLLAVSFVYQRDWLNLRGMERRVG